MRKMNLKKIISLLLAFVLTLSVALPNTPKTVSASATSHIGEATDTIPGNIIKNPEFESNDFATSGTPNFQWYPNGSTLSQDSVHKNAGSYSLKVSGRTAHWHRAEYREWFGNLAFDKDYYIQGAISAALATTLEMYVQVTGYGGPTGNEYPAVLLPFGSASVSTNEWQVLSGNVKLTSAPSATSGKIDVTVHFGETTQVIQAVTGIDNINIFVQEAYHENAVCPDIYLDSFLIKEGVAPHSEAENTESIAENKITNSSFETNDFASDHNHGKWYKTTDSTATISQVNNFSHSGNNSLKVSNRTVFWHRGQYRVGSGYLTEGTEYDLSGYVATGADTPVELIATVIGYGGPAENPYPSINMTLDTGTADSRHWEKLEGSFKITSVTNNTDSSKKDITVSWGTNTQTITGVLGYDSVEFFVQQPSSATSFPDLYLDSFAMTPAKESGTTGLKGHQNGVNTETVANNMIQNSSFESNDLATGMTVGKWYASGATLSQYIDASQSGSKSLKVSNRTNYVHEAQYRIEGSNFDFGRKYTLSGYAASASATTVDLMVGVYGYNAGTYPTGYVTLDSKSINSNGWTKLEGSFTINRTESAQEPGKYALNISYGNQSVDINGLVEGLSIVEIFVREHASNSCPDIYMDSFMLVGETPYGHQNGTNTESDTDNMILNSSFETNDLSTTETVGKWYAYGPTISQHTGASQSGSSSLKVSNRTAHWHRAQYRVEGSEITYEQEYSLSGYVAAESTATVDLMLGIWGYGGPTGNEYPVQYITLDTGVADINDWTKLESTFTVIREANATNPMKYDLTIAFGTQTVKVECVDGLSVVEIFVQEPYHGNTDCPDIYMDSFLLKAVKKQEEQKYPSGHQNGTNTEDDDKNIIQNSSFEASDFATGTVIDQWYPNGATISQFADASQSGKNSLRVTERTAHWHRAEYRVEGSKFASGRTYALSGYVAAEKSATVDLMLGVWGYGSAVGNGYSAQYITLDTGIADINEWMKLEGEFLIAQKPNVANPGKYDLVVAYGEQTAVIEGVDGLSVVEIFVQEAYHGGTDCPDLYLDSFLLKDITPEAERPTGHAGAEDTSANKKNLINNAGFEKNDYSSALTSGKWYADPSSVSLKSDTTFSHSGKASLLVSSREEHWNRATYQISAEKLVLGHTYALSGYMSATEDVNAELMVEIFGYTGSEDNREYVSQLLTFDTANVTSGKWSKLSGEFTITQKETSKEGIYDLVISWSGGEDVLIKNVNGLSAVRIMPQEAYNAATPRADLYLDSFLLEDITPAPKAPTGHSNQENTDILSDNLIKNGSFEKSDFVLGKYILDKWYTMEGCPATLTQDTTFSHSGKASLKVSGREEFWHRAEYRVEGNNFIMGDSYEVSGYVSALEDTNVEMLLQVYAFGGPESNPYPSQLLTVDADAVKAGEWTKLSAVFKITAKKSSEEGYYDYTITAEGNNNSYIISHVKGISLVQLMVQEAYSEVTPRTDLYLDSFVMRNQTKHNMPTPTGHTGVANTEDVLENMINNSSFESDLYEDEPNIGLWFTNGGNYNVEQTSKYSHSGEYSTRIYNRKAANHTLMYRVEGANIELGTEYTLSGYVAAALKTDVELVITVYGYAGDENNRTYPSQTIVLDRESVKDWTELLGGFMIQMEDGHLYVTTANGKVDVGQCLGLSNVEIYVLTDETVENYTTDLYLDTFSLIAGAATTKDTGNAEDILVSDFMEKKEDESALAKLMKAVEEFANNHTTAYVILIVVGLIIILGSVVIVIRSKRRKS